MGGWDSAEQEAGQSRAAGRIPVKTRNVETGQRRAGRQFRKVIHTQPVHLGRSFASPRVLTRGKVLIMDEMQ